MERLRLMLITSGGLGFMRPASGTWGSLPPPAVAFLLVLAEAPAWSRDAAMLAILLFSSGCCLMLGAWAEQRFGKKDDGRIVADETAGQCLPLLLLPAWSLATPGRAVLTLGAAFVLFRIMDIVKPPPARGLQRLKAGLGVLIDDLFAGLYAAIALQACLAAIVAI